jgi:hypothetical protein
MVAMISDLKTTVRSLGKATAVDLLRVLQSIVPPIRRKAGG